MVERRKRKPLVLASTKALVDSLLNSHRTAEDGDGIDPARSLQLTAGILRVSDDSPLNSVDASVSIGLSTAVLKQLSITSGSLVLINNVDANVSRIGQAVVLDPPNQDDGSLENGSVITHAPRTMLIFPSYAYPQTQPGSLDHQVAYLSPILAFNLNLHQSCLKNIVQQGGEKLSSLFLVKTNDEINEKENETLSVRIGLESWAKMPIYASHLRASFVKIPECGTLERLKTWSSEEAKDRQWLIDLALNDYFSVDRYLARGDLFSVCIDWNCKSELCIPCNQEMQNPGEHTIYFKVAAMEPSEEPLLRVNRHQTALVLGGGVPSAIPPDPLIPQPKRVYHLQDDAVLALASIVAPTLFPSALSSKFRVSILLHGAAGSGRRTVVRYVAHRLGLHVVEYSCHDFMASSEKKASIALAEAFSAARRYSPAILLLRHFEIFRNLAAQEGSSHEQVGVNSEVASTIKQFTEPITEDKNGYFDNHTDGPLKVTPTINQHPVLLVATVDSSEGLPPIIRRCFSHEIKMGTLSEEQRLQLLSQSFQHISDLLPDTSVQDLVKDLVGQTSGFMPRDLRALIADAGANIISKKLEPENSVPGSSESPSVEDSKNINNAPQDLSKENIFKALERSKKRNASALGTPKVPNVKWEDVGGLEDVKKSILDTVQLPLLHKDLFSSGLRKRSGVLLYGPPGTGKTLLAKAVATECSLNFLSVKGPELINMYIGESEKNVRDIFQKARAARPCVIFFDELDSLAPARGASGDSGGVMDRVVSQMLAEIDGLNDSTQDLFIIGASNRPDLIDAALLRPGRFDKLLYVGVNSEASYRERVLKALTRKVKLHEDVSLYEIALKCPPNFTGADMYALCADAWFHAAKRKVSVDDSASSPPDQPEAVVVEYEDFIEVLRELSPSLSMAELKKYEMLRDQFQGPSK
ncbi:peroxisome biogenesis protein 6 isoform X1 [Salvia hispanica]|uniref:peroxisome biogenesis protein 6 isoform X1 n=1 Tax=Salvia hispanica TaxID=49212 RepID=UPI002009D68F|nr:peroxisome biogenesis protein 6 isoform X1 [Salvia hispanica]